MTAAEDYSENHPAWLMASRRYREMGWRDSLPFIGSSKWPPPTGFTGYDGSAVTDDDLAEWSGDGRYSNVGLHLPAGIIGIDVDSYDGKQGHLTIAEREKQWGKLPPTWRSTSRWPDDGNSGIRLFRVPPGRSWHNPGKAHPEVPYGSVETIHAGWRYVICWPSRHDKTNRVYCWVDERTGEVIADVLPMRPEDLPELPAAWVKGLDKGEPPTYALGEKGDLPDEWKHPGACRRVARQVARGLTLLRDGGSTESRYDEMRGIAFDILGKAARGHAGADASLALLRSEYVSALSPKRGSGAANEWDRHVRDGVGKWRGATVTVEWCGGEDCGLAARPLPDYLAELAAASSPMLPAPTSPGADVGAGMDLGAASGTDEMKEARGQFVRERLPIVDWHALWADESEEEWIVEPILPARRLVALYSAPKVGKSLLLLEVAAAIAAGREVLGAVPDRARTVLYVDFENDPKADVRQRLINMGYGPGDLSRLCYLSFPTLGVLDSERGSQELMAAVEYHEAEVVVIDTVSRSVEGDENENDTWLDFYRHTGLKLKQAGVALIRLDHSGKDETKGQRGGSAKVGDVDAVWRMSRVTETVFRLDCEANRMPITEKMLTLHREEGPLRHRVDARGKGAAWDAQLDVWVDILVAHGLTKEPGINDTYAQLRALRDAGEIEQMVPQRKIALVREEIARRRGLVFEVSEDES